jgi:hypothetical protein
MFRTNLGPATIAGWALRQQTATVAGTLPPLGGYHFGTCSPSLGITIW